MGVRVPLDRCQAVSASGGRSDQARRPFLSQGFIGPSIELMTPVPDAELCLMLCTTDLALREPWLLHWPRATPG